MTDTDVQLAAGGPIIGIFFAWLMSKWMSTTRDSTTEITLIITLVLTVFFLAEHVRERY